MSDTISPIGPSFNTPPARVPAAANPAVDQPMDKNLPGWEAANNRTNGNPFNVGWRRDHVSFDPQGIMTLQLDDKSCPGACSAKPYASGEYVTRQTYGYGLYESRFKAAKGDGLVSSFFTFFATPEAGYKYNDEIDFEVLGKDTTQVQINYYNDHTTHIDHPSGLLEKMVPLGFDAAEGFHNYSILWTPDYIAWYVDGELKHTETGQLGKLPTHPSQIMTNLWAGTGVDAWLNQFRYKGPVTAQYDQVSFTPVERLGLAAAQTSPAPTLPTKLLGLIVAGQLPEEFGKYELPPDKYYNQNKAGITDATTFINGAYGLKGLKKGQSGFIRPIDIENGKKLVTNLFQGYGDIWLKRRENGDPSVADLNTALSKYFKQGAPYQKAKLAVILAMDPVKYQQQLKTLGFTVSSGGDKYALFQSLLKAYKDIPDSRLVGKIQLQLGIEARTPEIAEGHFRDAEQAFREAINAKEDAKDKYFQKIQKLFAYNPPLEFAIAKSEALMGQAQIEMFRAGEEKGQSAAQQRLITAYGLLSKAVANRFFFGLFLQQTKQLAAECLIRIAYIAKDLNQASVPLKLNGKERVAYSDLMSVGKSLLASTTEWNSALTKIIGQERKGQSAEAPLWLQQISAFAAVWEAKVAMVEAGEFEADTDAERLAGQTELLDQAAKTLDDLQTNSADALGAKTVADVQINRADNFARRGYRQLDEGNKPAAEKYFGQAVALLDEAAKCDKLHISIQSAAHKTRGDILTAQKELAKAEAEYTLAVDTYSQNYDALAGRADTRSWQGNHAEAGKDYQAVIDHAKSPLLLKRAKLGLAETAMRKNEVYAETEVNAFRTFVNEELLTIKAKALQPLVPRGSFLLPRAVQSVIEALGTDESNYDQLEKFITVVLNDQAGFTPSARLRAELYLEQAKIVSWQEKGANKKEQLVKARRLLDAIPADLLQLIGQDELLSLSYQLLDEELKMRSSDKPQTFGGRDLGRDILASRDADLISRFVLDQAEARNIAANAGEGNKKYSGLLTYLNSYLKRDSQELKNVEELFLRRGRATSFHRFKFELLEKQASVQLWNKEFATAHAGFTALYAAVDKLQLPAKISVPLKAKARFGLGEIYRYGEGYKNSPDKAEEYYLEARGLAASLDKKLALRNILLAQISFGLAGVENQINQPELAWQYLRDASKYLDAAPGAPAFLKGEINKMKQNVQEPLAKAGVSIFGDNKGTLETRTEATGRLPLLNDGATFYLQGFLDTHSNTSDTVPNPIRGDGEVATAYFGLKLKPFLPGESAAAQWIDNWLLGKRTTLDLKYKLGSLAAEDKPTLPLSFRRPQVAGSLVSWRQWTTAALSFEWDPRDSSLNTLYADVRANLGGTRHRFLQAQVGPVCSLYTFKNLGKDRARRFCGVGVNYTLDLADVNNLVNYNTAKLNFNFTLPIWEFERERASGYMEHDSEVDRYIFSDGGPKLLGLPLGPVPWQGRASIDLNFGQYGLLQLYAGGGNQVTKQFDYANWSAGFNYQFSY